MGCTASRAAATTFVTSATANNNNNNTTTTTNTVTAEHPPLHPGDTHHVVTLTSSTYGSLDVLLKRPSSSSSPMHDRQNPNPKPLWHYLSLDHLLSQLHPSVSSTLHHHRTNMTHHLSKPKPLTVVLYTTSFHGVRRTHEDCRAVRAILRAHRAAVDERDLAMDRGLRVELEGLVGRKGVALPQVFVGGSWVGGAEEVTCMDETGELRVVLEGVEREEEGSSRVCAGCGGARFAVCTACCGSRKVFVEEEGGKRSCHHCNENGLVRCSLCWW